MKKIILVLVCILFLSGCAVNTDITLDESLKAHEKIDITLIKLLK